MGVTFDIKGQSAVITGGAGVLCAAMCRALVEAGARVAVLDLRAESAEALAAELGENAIGLACDVLNKASIEAAAQKILQAFTKVDILINGAGGNHPSATTGPDKKFFDLPIDAFGKVMNLNILGTILPSMVFGKAMAERGDSFVVGQS